MLPARNGLSAEIIVRAEVSVKMVSFTDEIKCAERNLGCNGCNSPACECLDRKTSPNFHECHTASFNEKIECEAKCLDDMFCYDVCMHRFTKALSFCPCMQNCETGCPCELTERNYDEGFFWNCTNIVSAARPTSASTTTSTLSDSFSIQDVDEIFKYSWVI